jgi:hypothetical protein
VIDALLDLPERESADHRGGRSRIHSVGEDREEAAAETVILSEAKDLKIRGCLELEILRRLRGSG